MSRLNATKNYAKDKTICFPKYLAPFSIVFKVIEVFSGAKIRQIVVLEVASSFARRFTEINSNLYLYCTKVHPSSNKIPLSQAELAFL